MEKSGARWEEERPKGFIEGKNREMDTKLGIEFGGLESEVENLNAHAERVAWDQRDHTERVAREQQQRREH